MKNKRLISLDRNKHTFLNKYDEELFSNVIMKMVSEEEIIS